ncbi:LOW QUALITY PROTEIN: leucine-rich repeat-containing protein 14 [Protobothrops mucrosquamatus]|uniref:LOW QUALITY PROTEIN: leucine-rich repeat-containing protein 14 n=1 Tax=Protobothrops mucrosquamatus TaxID=103944 RepID=UPI0010FB9224|nr:LOW QUALITY PROTEIN: leucine-rich repeat-containing protein 14 [Protobothrops mucrosquamatus]
MYSLVFLCAQKVVSHYTTLQDALGFLPKELYPVLFKAAFMDKRTPSLQQLVQTWPFHVLSFQKLLRKCQHCERALIREKPNKLCIQAIILGVVTYLMKMLEDRNRTKSKGQRLQILDMTGLQDEGQGPESMSLWSRTVTLAKACLDVSKQQSKCLKRSSKRRKGPYSSSVAVPAPQPVSVDVWVDLFVNSTSYVVLKDALQINSNNALRLRCRDFRAEELSIASTVGLLEFLDPAGVRQVDLDLRSPLESLELAFCYLLPNDFAYLSQSLHTSALKKLDLSGNNLSDSRVSNELQQMLLSANRGDAIWTTNLCRHNSLDYFSL